MSAANVQLAYPHRASRSADRLIARIDGEAVMRGFRAGWSGQVLPREVAERVAAVRALWGFAPTASRLTTPASAQHKLGLAATPSSGLTLHHHRHRSRVGQAPVNLCPWAGSCVDPCVLKNGNGRYSSVQRAWAWRTDLLLADPVAFGVLWGAELAADVRAAGGHLLHRPNVNSDIPWHLVAPDIVNGSVTGTAVMFYDYSKNPDALIGNGWATRVYRVAASVSEHTGRADIEACLRAGGSVAVVTDRRRGAPVTQWHPTSLVVDADISDAWMFTGGTIGDLSFKPRDRDVARRGLTSGFVQRVYEQGHTACGR